MLFVTGADSPVSTDSVRLQVRRFTQPKISGDDISRLKDHNIAGNQFVRINHADLTTTPHPCADLGNAHQCFYGARCFEFGKESDGRIEDQHKGDGDAFGDVTQNEGYHSCSCQKPYDNAV